MILRASDLSRVRKITEKTMTSTGDILRPAGASDGEWGYTEVTEVAIAGVRCRIAPVQSQFAADAEPIIADVAITPQELYFLAFPYGTDVRINDRFRDSSTGNIYHIRSTGRFRSATELVVRCSAFMMGIPPGRPAVDRE